MDITFKIEKYEAGIVITIHGREYEIDLQSLDRQFVEIEIDPDELDLHQIDNDTMKNHLESIHGPIYMESEESEMIEHLENCYGEIFREGEESEMMEHLTNEGYFVAQDIDSALKVIEEEIYPYYGKWIVDPGEIDEVDTMEFITEALHKKGYYILKIPSCLKGLIGGSK
tara:strand:- start:555 stop:1064 length:510 start_codon:yes stop_codon:yes gene_type:complete